YPTLPLGTLGYAPALSWASVEPTPGVFDFTGFDSYMADAISHKLVDSTNTASVVVTLGGTPPWAAADPASCAVRGGVARCTSGPVFLEDWTGFITAVMHHYNGVTQPHIRYYELWDEANRATSWSGSTFDLVNLASAAYTVIHHDSRS